MNDVLSLMAAFKPFCVVSAIVLGVYLLYQPLEAGQHQQCPPQNTRTTTGSWRSLPVPLPVMPRVAGALSAWHDARAQVHPINTNLTCGINVSSEVSARVYAKATSQNGCGMSLSYSI